MLVRPPFQALAAGIGLLLLLSVSADAAGLGKPARRGKAILQESCGRCHAVEAVGRSPMPSAPPMRVIYSRFNPRELQAELSEGKVSRHREMPQIEFSDEDVHAILSYLYALSRRR